jgi:hypothetical protein
LRPDGLLHSVLPYRVLLLLIADLDLRTTQDSAR